MRYSCPHCSRSVGQVQNTSGPIFCLHCRSLFHTPEPEKVSPWLLGMVVVLMGNWQIIWHITSAAG